MRTEWKGLCVGGQSYHAGQVISCSRSFWQHLGPDNHTYLKYVWEDYLSVWVPEGTTLDQALDQLKSAYTVQEVGSVPALKTQLKERIERQVIERVNGRGWEQKAVAKSLGVHPSYVNRIIKRARHGA